VSVNVLPVAAPDISIKLRLEKIELERNSEDGRMVDQVCWHLCIVANDALKVMLTTNPDSLLQQWAMYALCFAGN